MSKPWTDKELESFVQNLRQVIQWTEKLSFNYDFQKRDHSRVFRQTNPVVNGVSLYRFEKFDVEWNIDNSDDMYDLLLDMAVSAREKNFQRDLSALDHWGRIICFDTCISTYDGAPSTESNQFVDHADVPPIDTWFFVKRNYVQPKYYSSQTLFCWIPKAFEQLMKHTMEVEILGTYAWLDETDKDLYDRITAYDSIVYRNGRRIDLQHKP